LPDQSEIKMFLEITRQAYELANYLRQGEEARETYEYLLNHRNIDLHELESFCEAVNRVYGARFEHE